MKGETLIEVLDKLNRINNHGVSFLGIDPEDVAVVEHQTLIFPSQEASNLINDNYSVFPTRLNLSRQTLDSIVKKVNQTRFCSVAVSVSLHKNSL